jgi:hypothetical protein
VAFQQAEQLVTVPAGSDLSTKQFYAVKVGSTSKLALCGTSNQALGILTDKPAADGAPGAVCIFGFTKAIAGGTITPGNMVATDSAGKLVAAASGDIAVGIAIGAGGTISANDVFTLFVTPIGKIW